MNESPVIFIHYGKSEYLKYTFKAAKLNNPHKKIILLGDHQNKKIAQKEKISFYNYNEYYTGPEVELFNNVFKLITGSNFTQNEFWVKFVFMRWFIIYQFLKFHNINKFWTFDSDTLILTDLEKQEHKFLNYDCTEQCNGICMNGFVSNINVVEGYINKINQLFQREDYLEMQKRDFKKNPTYSFTEMRAYDTYKKEENIKSIRLNTIIENESFDDCICQEHDMELYSSYLIKSKIKKLYISEKGEIFCNYIPSNLLIKMNSLNLSWVPNFLFYKILHEIKKRRTKTKTSNSDKGLEVITFSNQPYLFKIRDITRRVISKIMLK